MASLVAVYLTVLGQTLALSASNSDTTAHQANSAYADCIRHTVKSGDTCWSIARANGVFPCHLMTWNPIINTACS